MSTHYERLSLCGEFYENFKMIRRYYNCFECLVNSILYIGCLTIRVINITEQFEIDFSSSGNVDEEVIIYLNFSIFNVIHLHNQASN